MTPHKFSAVFQNMWEEASNDILFEESNLSRIVDVHPSQIPICPCSFILGIGEDMARQKKMVGTSIVDMGSAVHRVVQDFLGNSEYAFGDFICPKCGEIFPLRTGGMCPNNCGCHLRYEEVGINYKGFVGHVDFLVKKDDEIWLVDFKTSNSFGIPKKIKQTPESYHLQTLAYALLLRLQHGIKVKGRAIAYISRDNPSTVRLGGVQEITKKDLKYIQGVLKDQRELLTFLLNVKSYDEFMESIGIQRCNSPYCSVCTKMINKDIKKALKAKFKSLNGKCMQDFVNDYLEKGVQK